ncbi:MAG: phosphate ABC transporter ATP-binding protein [Synergistes sp.]|nr:phosphate ABC transporter ATP-binding protein [Synergistes sp.]
MEYCVKAENLSVSFGGKTVLHNITTEVAHHGITVFLGRSGSGKTTFLRCINRLNDCFQNCTVTGTLFVCMQGKLTDVCASTSEISKIRRTSGMVFQTPNPLPMTVRRNITLPLELTAGIKGATAEEKMEAALREVGMWEEAKDRLNEDALHFSGGQQQRICLARTLALSPEILLLDEPTASLDKKSSELIENLLERLKERVPIIMVSHSLAQARKLGTHFKILSEGKLTKEFERDDIPKDKGEKFLEDLL